MHAYLSPELPQLELCKCFDKFTVESLRKGDEPRRHDADARVLRRVRGVEGRTSRADRRLRAQPRRDAHPARRLLQCGARVTQGKTPAPVVRRSPAQPCASAGRRVQGDALAAVLRERYRAALIDEFQDTDPLQYGIFRRIYAGFEMPGVPRRRSRSRRSTASAAPTSTPTSARARDARPRIRWT